MAQARYLLTYECLNGFGVWVPTAQFVSADQLWLVAEIRTKRRRRRVQLYHPQGTTAWIALPRSSWPPAARGMREAGAAGRATTAGRR